MPKFLIEGCYLAEGLRGLVKVKTLEGVCDAASALAASVSGRAGAKTIHPGVNTLDRIALRPGRFNL